MKKSIYYYSSSEQPENKKFVKEVYNKVSTAFFSEIKRKECLDYFEKAAKNIISILTEKERDEKVFEIRFFIYTNKSFDKFKISYSGIGFKNFDFDYDYYSFIDGTEENSNLDYSYYFNGTEENCNLDYKTSCFAIPETEEATKFINAINEEKNKGKFLMDFVFATYINSYTDDETDYCVEKLICEEEDKKENNSNHKLCKCNRSNNYIDYITSQLFYSYEPKETYISYLHYAPEAMIYDENKDLTEALLSKIDLTYNKNLDLLLVKSFIVDKSNINNPNPPENRKAFFIVTNFSWNYGIDFIKYMKDSIEKDLKNNNLNGNYNYKNLFFMINDSGLFKVFFKDSLNISVISHTLPEIDQIPNINIPEEIKRKTLEDLKGFFVSVEKLILVDRIKITWK